MAFDFPSSPTLGQQFTPVAGVTYTWNGYGWTSGGNASARLDAYDAMYATKIDKFRSPSGTFTFSEGDLRADKTGGGNTNYGSVFSQSADPMLDQIYFEATILNTSGTCLIGFCNKNEGASTNPGNGVYSLGLYNTGSFYYNAVSSPGYPSFVNGDTVACALRIPSGTVWFRNVTTSGNWMNQPTHDPATNTGGSVGYGFMYNYGAIQAQVAFYNLNGSVRFNFDGSFLGAVPAGYVRWRGRAL